VARGRHIPIRTCVGCRGSTAKKELVRIVRTLEGRVEVDPTGKKPGRGAYICPNYQCWKEALRKERLAHALRTTLSPQDREALLAYAESFKEKVST